MRAQTSVIGPVSRLPVVRPSTGSADFDPPGRYEEHFQFGKSSPNTRPLAIRVP
jgi:hypothetical protein